MTVNKRINFKKNQLVKSLKKNKVFKKTILTLVLRRIQYKNRLLFIHKKYLNCPQKGGRCTKLFVVRPKKPNSAKRKVVRVVLNNEYTVDCHIPGSSSNHGLQSNSRVMIQPASVPDLPGINFRVIRGCKDCFGDFLRMRSRSRYGAKSKFFTAS